ncbi:hypothetical protein BRADI_4g13575v3 [Brachypodium distachyon]|uniref:NAC domain-containing protein n=1 Tax=Brachypodium distachyon TaxID=15368 RepID=A0A0Q3H302_BRADI|nr:hypothetical protein BRADI_4g13575v3 [Brachypodium distachyon]
MAMPEAGREGLGLPIGFWFMPNDEELTVYLRKKPGTEELVVVSPRRVPVALKQPLIFFSADGARTRWVMHEYRLHPALLARAASIGKDVENRVVCRVFWKATRRDGNLQDMRRPLSPASSCVTEELGDDDEEKMATSN